MAQPEIAVLVSSFERPRHVRRVLASIAAQRGVRGAFEVIVTDDGSRDETPRMVRQFAASANFPVRFVTHPHEGFHIARCRNEGVQASTAPYLLFLDGDCIIPPDHLRAHLDRRRAGAVMAGYPIYIKQADAEQITENDVRDGGYLSRIPLYKHLKMRWRHMRGAFATLIGDPKRPKLLGGNLGIARTDYERINGYDENFRGWGCEDDDLRLRLRAAGIGVASIAWWTNTYHLWHPKTSTAPATWRAGANVDYLNRPLRLTRCLTGLAKRRPEEVLVELVGRRPSAEMLNRLPLWCRLAIATTRPSHEAAEIQIAFADGSDAKFSDRSDCRVLIVPTGQVASRSLARGADLAFADHQVAGVRADHVFPLRDLTSIVQQQLGVSKPSWQQVARPVCQRVLSLPAAA